MPTPPPPSTPPIRSGRSLALALAAALAARAPASNTPEHACLIVDPIDPLALRLANHYDAIRDLAPNTALFMRPASSNLALFRDRNVAPLLGELDARGLTDHTDLILIAPTDSFRVFASDSLVDQCVIPAAHVSLTSAYMLSFLIDDALANTASTSALDGYIALDPIQPFDASVAYYLGQPSTDERARRTFLAAQLGQTGETGNTPEELIALYQRSADADATFPAGTVYYMDNQADAARNVRQPTFADAVSRLAAIGADGQILPGQLPLGQHDAVGVLSGFANADIDAADLTLLPGAFADHLTSFAATFSNLSQTKASAWIRKGASASFGTVEEPCNIALKFPRALTHVEYQRGLSLGEAIYRGLTYFPYQGLIYGDPLTRAFTHIPAVSVPDAPHTPATPVSGQLVLTPIATTTHPTAGISTLTLLIDGLPTAEIDPGQTFSIDTTTLDEGHHDIRVIATDDSNIRARGRWVGAVMIDNAPQGAVLSVSSTTGDLTTPFTCSVTPDAGTVERFDILHLGRVVASGGPGQPDPVVHGRILGAGPVELAAVVHFSNGTSANTVPITLTIDPTEGAPGAGPPIVRAYPTTITLRPGSTQLVQLPSTFAAPLDTASWMITDTPDQASFVTRRGSAVVFRVDDTATGTDTMAFTVSADAQTSAPATITIIYQGPDCPPDLAPPAGILDFNDVIAFLTAFAIADPSADFALPIGTLDFNDVIAFLQLFALGCP